MNAESQRPIATIRIGYLRLLLRSSLLCSLLYVAPVQGSGVCPVTLPADRPIFEEDRGFSSFRQAWFGDENLAALIPVDGHWTGMGPERSYRDKLWWRSSNFDAQEEPRPNLIVSGQRLDGPAPPIKVSPTTHGNSQGWSAMLVGVEIPTNGCWRITGIYQGAHELSFVVRVGEPVNSELSDAAFAGMLEVAALERTHHQVVYDGSYRRIEYPGGDVPKVVGVCTDVVVRSYRALGVDLQVLVHNDMREHFSEYPDLWGLTRPDSNIDHRRVPNLQAFFSRHGEVLTTSESASDYAPGDLVTWMLPGNLPHIGIVSGKLAEDNRTPLVVHNIGSGPELENILFSYPMTGHYRYRPSKDM